MVSMTYLFVLSFCVYVGSTVGHGENSVQSKAERESSIAHLMYLFMKDINDIYDESRALKDKIGALEAQILDIDSKTKDVDSKTKDLESKTEDINDIINENRGLKEKVDALETQILVLDSRTDDLDRKTEELRWAEWGLWGSCAASCSGGVGERLQSRTRRKRDPDDTTSQTESRPCNSVQFAGCLHPNNTDQFFAVAYDYSNTLAQATCAAMASGGYIRAVKRTCSSSAADCNTVCKNVGQTCFNALHVYSGSYAPPVNRDATGQKSLIMFKYNGCGGEFCGPNFCCCRSGDIVWN